MAAFHCFLLPFRLIHQTNRQEKLLLYSVTFRVYTQETTFQG